MQAIPQGAAITATENAALTIIPPQSPQIHQRGMLPLRQTGLLGPPTTPKQKAAKLHPLVWNPFPAPDPRSSPQRKAKRRLPSLRGAKRLRRPKLPSPR
jgi:hypothetical protein